MSVGADYHVEVDGHRYSVPHALARQKAEARLTEAAVEVLRDGQPRAGRGDDGPGPPPAGAPRAGAPDAGERPAVGGRGRAGVGPETRRMVGSLLDAGEHPQERLRSCVGLTRLARQDGNERMEAAARRALHFGTAGYESARRILDNGKDREPLPGDGPVGEPVEHEHVRGGAYYGSEGKNGETKGGKEESC